MISTSIRYCFVDTGDFLFRQVIHSDAKRTTAGRWSSVYRFKNLTTGLFLCAKVGGFNRLLGMICYENHLIRH